MRTTSPAGSPDGRFRVSPDRHPRLGGGGARAPFGPAETYTQRIEIPDRTGPTQARRALARTADALTACRALLAVALIMLLAGGALSAGAVVLGAAWITDAADGAVAKAAGGGTRLGEWDMPVDTAVGAGVLAGLALHGWFPLLPAVVLVVVLGTGYLYLRNPAIGQALQAVAWAAMLWRLWSERSPWGWVPVAVAAGIGVAERRRFANEVLPAFFRGAAAIPRLRRGSSFRLTDGPQPR
jgi:phosphatidylglycerophosphate synthase